MSAFGTLLEFGAGVEKNAAEARKHYEKASNLNDASAHWKLGVAFENGMELDFQLY